MRELTDHKVNGLNEALTIIAIDNPGPGGANHKWLQKRTRERMARGVEGTLQK